ncbi:MULTISPECIES: MarR family transcriptional regulator [unclassified Mesobacillus]|jgi:MarR family transcriptional regulator, 2-MHQ and catechol-resistance regulon repressor|uniref:MarR family winged helix-turn-helix transcriptional regulator n=1 Tax=unclassified Mesobacillus TaxID=2675270 RepID=UPI00203C4B2D|nr:MULTISPECIES: MarR family transcriptional regulator [unclassified Mesobacillus]MCM3124514.1 MarR family transcriptional regulator [Mesobacillus sp. MER 33]MCM3234776.1 MarR family transcriptional regulator [Mesobacillus sp. MER 48]
MEKPREELKAVTVIIRAAQAIHDVIRKDAAQYGLNPTEFSVMELLYHRGEQPIQIIGKKVLISSGSITYVIDKLVEKNYVRRRACPEDRRVTYGVLTNEGKELMDTIFPQHEMEMSRIFADLDAEEVNQTISLLKRIGYRAKGL